MEIKILPNKNKSEFFKPEMRIKMNELISRFQKILDEDEIDSLVKETNEILSNCTNPNLFVEQNVTHLKIGRAHV